MFLEVSRQQLVTSNKVLKSLLKCHFLEEKSPITINYIIACACSYACSSYYGNLQVI